MSIPFTPFPNNPTRLSDRYEVRQLKSEDYEWVTAVCCHSHTFHSPVWSVAYPDNQVQRMHSMVANAEYMINHGLESGMSFGIFDLEYEFKRPESEATGGKLYWDENETGTNSTNLLEQMDFPLCSVALAYDGINEMDMSRMKGIMEVLPHFLPIHSQFEATDKRDPASWKQTGPKEVLLRNSTVTRADYAGEGLMKQLAQWLMRQAAEEGFRATQIECAHDAVNHVWLHPPKPYSAELIGKVDPAILEEKDTDGNTLKPLSAVKQAVTQVFVILDHDAQLKFQNTVKGDESTVSTVGVPL